MIARKAVAAAAGVLQAGSEEMGFVQRLGLLLFAFILCGGGALIWLRGHDFSSASGNSNSGSAAPIASAVIEKQPPVVTTRRFNPANPPRDMPPLQPGELAVTDTNFGSDALVSGHLRSSGGDGAETITQVRVQLQLKITIWVPEDVTEKVLEHEEGHRQISEAYYASADEVVRRIGAAYIGKQIPISGGDLSVAAQSALQQIGSEITVEYNRQLDPEPAQLKFDSITDHARNDVTTKDAVAQVLAHP